MIEIRNEPSCIGNVNHTITVEVMSEVIRPRALDLGQQQHEITSIDAVVTVQIAAIEVLQPGEDHLSWREKIR